MFNLNELESSVQHIVYLLKSEDRKKRKETVKTMFEQFNSLETNSSELVLCFDAVRLYIWSALNDPAECVRNEALNLIRMIIEKTPCKNIYLEELIPILLHGLTGLREPSEELRLNLVKLLNDIITKYNTNMEPYTFDIISTLTETLMDKYMEVRVESGECCCRLADAVQIIFLENCSKLVVPIVACFKQRQSKVRISATRALEATLRDASWKTLDASIIFGTLGERMFDESVKVRLAVVDLLGSWLVKLRERYSFFGRMVPLMLGYVRDEDPNVAEKAALLWAEAGRVYLAENEQSLQDKIGFLDVKPDHYPSVGERPNLGCRTLVQLNMYQICPAIIPELTHWQPSVCVKSSALLISLIIHAEDEMTQHLNTILDAMFTAVENKHLPLQSRNNIETAAEYIAYFIPVSTWAPVMIECTIVTQGKLNILSALVRGSKPNSVEVVCDKLAAILDDDYHYSNTDVTIMLEMLKCCRALLDNVNIVSESSSKKILNCLCNITAGFKFDPDTAALAQAGQDCLHILGNKAVFCQTNLIQENIMMLLENVEDSVAAWSPNHSHFKLLIFLLSLSDSTWFAAEETILRILRKAFRLDQGDAVVKTYLFITLSALFVNAKENSEIGSDEFKTFAGKVLKDLVLPNLAWRSGLVAEKLRTTVLKCLFNIINYFDEFQYNCEIDDVLTSVIVCLGDNPTDNRQLAMMCIDSTIRMQHQAGRLTANIVNVIYLPVLERLNDPVESVRSKAVKTLQNIFTRLPKDFNEKSYAAALRHIVTVMLPYLDDDDDEMRTTIYDALKLLTKYAPNIFGEKVRSEMHLFKSKELCVGLLELLK